jgi:EmrB/QacA subfamily drug resistance transporter
MYNTTNKTCWIALIGISLANFLGCLDFTIVNTGLPIIQHQLSAKVTELQWVINSFMLALSATMVVMGRIADIYGRRKILYIGMAVFAVSSLGAGLAPNINTLILFRLLQGLSVSILYTVPMAMIASIFPQEHQGKAIGILVGISGFGLALGPVIGGFLIELLGWRSIFLVNLPVILVSFVICLKTLNESKSHEHGNNIDWGGLLLLIIAFPSLIFATVNGSDWGFLSPKTLALYTIGCVSLVALYRVEKNKASPIICFKLFANRLFLSGIAANFALAFSYATVFFLMPLYLHNVLGLQTYQVGLILLPASVMVALLSPVVGYLIDKLGVKQILMCGFTLFAISAYMQSTFTDATTISFIVSASIIFGIAWACVLSPSINAALSSVPATISGVAIGSLGTLHNFGGAVGLAIAATIYQKTSLVNKTNALLESYNSNMWLLVCVSLAVLIFVFLNLKKERR